MRASSGEHEVRIRRNVLAHAMRSSNSEHCKRQLHLAKPGIMKKLYHKAPCVSSSLQQKQNVGATPMHTCQHRRGSHPGSRARLRRLAQPAKLRAWSCLLGCPGALGMGEGAEGAHSCGTGRHWLESCWPKLRLQSTAQNQSGASTTFLSLLHLKCSRFIRLRPQS